MISILRSSAQQLTYRKSTLFHHECRMSDIHFASPKHWTYIRRVLLATRNIFAVSEEPKVHFFIVTRWVCTIIYMLVSLIWLPLSDENRKMIRRCSPMIGKISREKNTIEVTLRMPTNRQWNRTTNITFAWRWNTFKHKSIRKNTLVLCLLWVCVRLYLWHSLLDEWKINQIYI